MATNISTEARTEIEQSTLATLERMAQDNERARAALSVRLAEVSAVRNQIERDADIVRVNAKIQAHAAEQQAATDGED